MNWLPLIGTLINRIPFERILLPPRDNAKALRDFATDLTEHQSQNKPPSEGKMTVPTQEPETVAKQEDAGTACDICSLDHISTCAGILEEANRFGRRDGVGNPEVIRRISICRKQLNALERDDANPQKLVQLPDVERKIMERILPKTGKLRHRLNEIVSLETLEQVAAEAQNLSDEFQTSIFHLQLTRGLAKNKIRNEKPEILDTELNELGGRIMKCPNCGEPLDKNGCCKKCGICVLKGV